MNCQLVVLLVALILCFNTKETKSKYVDTTSAATNYPKGPPPPPSGITDTENGTTTDLVVYNNKREKRSVWSVGLTALNVVCSIAKIPHKLCQDYGCGHYGTLNKEMQYYMNELKMIKAYIPCRKDQLGTLKAQLLKSFEVFEFSVVKVGAVVKTYDDLNKGLAMFKNLSASNLGLDVLIDSEAIRKFMSTSTPQDLSDTGIGWGKLSQDIGGDLAILASFELTLGLTKVFNMIADGDSIINGIVKKGAQEAMSEFKDIFSDAMAGFNIALKITKLVSCIKDHFNMYSNRVEERDNIKKMYDNAKIALKDLDAITNQIEDAVGRFNNETDKLVKFTNDFLAIFNSTCKSSPATLTSDLGELKHFVGNLKENFDSLVDIDQGIKAATSLALQTLEQFKPFCMAPLCDFEALKAAALGKAKVITPTSRSSFDAMRMKFPDIPVDKLIDKMRGKGFVFPEENWDSWRTATKIDSSCSCEDPATKCINEEIRSCRGSCLGPAAREVDRCNLHVDDKFHFFRMCNSRDQAHRGHCTTTANNSIEDGDVAGHYVSSGVTQAQCFKDCKGSPGSQGCEFFAANCFVGDCTGPCFAFHKKISHGSSNPAFTCYGITAAMEGEPVPSVLRAIFDATQKTMSGNKRYNTQDFNDMMLGMMNIDKDLIESQENGWKEVINYQQSRTDPWGKSPSDYSERNRTILSIGNRTLMVIEPCNFASNWGYYHLMMASSSFPWMKKETKKAIGQASAGLALSSAFFHGSHTKLGRDMDNLMIKILSFILHQAYIDLLELPPGEVSLFKDLKLSGRRPLTGVQMAKFMTELFRTKHSSGWATEIKTLDVPDYELSCSALTFALLTHLGKTGSTVDRGGKKLMKLLQVPEKDIKFVMGDFLPKLRNAMSKKNTTFTQRPDVYNSITTGFRLLMAFPFQEQFISKRLTILRDLILSILPHEDFNNFLTSRSTLPLIGPLKSGVKAPCKTILKGILVQEEEYPGASWCKQREPHSIWHLQSAKGLLDLFQFIDEIVGKQVSDLSEIPENITEDSNVAELIKLNLG